MNQPLRIISWNVNGIRACLKKGFEDFVREYDPDILCLQEIKADAAEFAKLEFTFPYIYANSAEKKGYSGTAVLSKIPAEECVLGMQDPADTGEGRVISCKFPGFVLVNVYTPNSQDGLRRLSYRQQEWDPAFRRHLSAWDAKIPIVSCGDFNVAHQEIDIARPDANRRSAGFTDEEREEFGKLLDTGFVDTFRHFNPDARDQYTWWSYRAGARQRNIGWRIDYFLASQRLLPMIKQTAIFQSVEGSDHCPVMIELAHQ